MVKLKSAIIVLLFYTTVFSQNDRLDYYPMHIGDEWKYNKLLYDYFDQDTISFEVISEYITGDTLLDDNYKYFKYRINTDHGEFTNYRRIDTLKSTVIQYSKCETFFLNAHIDSVWMDSCGQYNYTWFDTSTVNDFGIIRPKIIFVQPFNIFDRTFSKGIGLTYREEGDLGLHLIHYLVYAKVDGIVYDTPTTLDNNSNKHPSSPQLSQNFPNPFNSETKIEIYTPKSEYITLTIYNIMGELVEEIHEGFLSPGSHYFKWNANTHSSGVYFYKMKSQHISLVKKMLLIR
jgi:hypothetical protein